MKFSGLFPPVLTEKDDKTISLSIILEIKIVFEEFLMMGSVDNPLFQEKIKNFNSSVSDFSVRIPSKNGANDDLKFFEKFFGVGEKTDGSAFFSSFSLLNLLMSSVSLYNTLCSHSELGMKDLFCHVASSFAFCYFPFIEFFGER